MFGSFEIKLWVGFQSSRPPDVAPRLWLSETALRRRVYSCRGGFGEATRHTARSDCRLVGARSTIKMPTTVCSSFALRDRQRSPAAILISSRYKRHEERPAVNVLSIRHVRVRSHDRSSLVARAVGQATLRCNLELYLKTRWTCRDRSTQYRHHRELRITLAR